MAYLVQHQYSISTDSGNVQGITSERQQQIMGIYCGLLPGQKYECLFRLANELGGYG